MNKHQDEINMLVMEIMATAFAINTKTEYAVFIDFSGHIDNLRISIKKSAEDYNTLVAETECSTVPRSWMDTQREFDGLLGSIKEKRDVLKKIAIDCKIDSDDMYEVVHKTYSYAFQVFIMNIYFDVSIMKWVAEFCGLEAVDSNKMKACAILFRMETEL